MATQVTISGYDLGNSGYIPVLSNIWQQVIAGGGAPASMHATPGLMPAFADEIGFPLRNPTAAVTTNVAVLDYWTDGTLTISQINVHTPNAVIAVRADAALPAKTVTILNASGVVLVQVTFP